MKPLAQSTDEEVAALDAVCDRLARFGVETSTEWVDGYLTALVASRRAVTPSEWLPAMFGDDFGRAFADPADVQQAMSALLGRWNVIASQLDPESLIDEPDQLRLMPLMQIYDDPLRREIVDAGAMTAEDAERLQTGALWCLGFQEAIDAFADDWPDPDPDTDDGELYEDCLSSVFALALAGDDLAAYQRENYPGQTVTRDELIDDACFAVQDLRIYWIDHAPRPEPRRVDPRPGRNDPCPCGSGRKYKKCHGAGLH